MSRVTVNGVGLNVEVAGEGPHVLLLHGFTGSAATWALSWPLRARSRYTGSTPRVCSVGLMSNSAWPGLPLAAGSIQAVMPRLLL